MANIFSFLNPNSNDMISKMNSKELNEFKTLLNEFQLELRNNLGFDKNVTFGMEFECELADIDQIMCYLYSMHLDDKVDVKNDVSLNAGVEITTPVYFDIHNVYKEISNICKGLNQYAFVYSNTGSHIHIGSQILEKKENLYKFLYLWMAYEDIIFRFTNGEFLTARPNIYLYSLPLRRQKNLFALDIASLSLKDLKEIFIDTSVRLSNISSLKKIEYKNTIEFRCPNGTLEPVIWQNNLNLFVKMIEYAKSSDFDYSTLENSTYDFNDISDYDKVCFEEAIKFADLIFKNNLDKIYFLRQYFKDYEVSNKYIKAKKFVK